MRIISSYSVVGSIRGIVFLLLISCSFLFIRRKERNTYDTALSLDAILVACSHFIEGFKP